MKSTRKSSKSTKSSVLKSAAKTHKLSPSPTGIKLTKDQQRIRKELLTQGWALVDTSRYDTSFSLDKRRADKTNNIPFDAAKIATDFWFSQKKYRKRWKTPPNLVPFRNFLTRTIRKCVPEENLSLIYFQLRSHIHIDQKSLPGSWHVDGGCIRVITPVKGEATEFLPHPRSKKILSVPQGWSLFFTGCERTFNGKIPKRDILGNVIETERKCLTRHRMPAHNGKRKLIVVTFSNKRKGFKRVTRKRATRK